jgi:equilibrative nucleoside transporter 1/2/3
MNSISVISRRTGLISFATVALSYATFVDKAYDDSSCLLQTRAEMRMKGKHLTEGNRSAEASSSQESQTRTIISALKSADVSQVFFLGMLAGHSHANPSGGSFLVLGGVAACIVFAVLILASCVSTRASQGSSPAHQVANPQLEAGSEDSSEAAVIEGASSPHQSSTMPTFACVYMTLIGMGYLFPISALWSAFDYWKVVFPGQNVEFEITCVYQLFCCVTVLCLSLTSDISFSDRIIGGFCGQFICIAIIFGLLWVDLDQDILFYLLLCITAMVATATGFLDSALLSFCSQYSHEAGQMQAAMQIGVGFSSDVSVYYRDITKLAVAHPVSSASAYFVITLLTLLVCLSAYVKLLGLPFSEAVLDAEQDRFGFVASVFLPRSPRKLPSAYIGNASIPAMITHRRPTSVFIKVWMNQLTIFLNLFLTTVCFPGILTSIRCYNFSAFKHEHWFQILIITAFSLSDTCGRFATRYRCGLNHNNIWMTILVRGSLLPVILACATGQIADDRVSFVVVILFGALSGHCISLSLITINEIPNLSQQDRPRQNIHFALPQLSKRR